MNSVINKKKIGKMPQIDITIIGKLKRKHLQLEEETRSLRIRKYFPINFFLN